MDAWVNSLGVRYVYGTVPTMDGQYVGAGDFDSDQVYQDPAQNEVDAVLLGPSSDQAAGWAMYMKQQQKLSAARSSGTPSPSSASSSRRTTAPRCLLPRSGTSRVERVRGVYARTAWDASAFWSVFASMPEQVSDHHHSRGVRGSSSIEEATRSSSTPRTTASSTPWGATPWRVRRLAGPQGRLREDPDAVGRGGSPWARHRHGRRGVRCAQPTSPTGLRLRRHAERHPLRAP